MLIFVDKNFVIAPIFRDYHCDMPTIFLIQNFREDIFRDPKLNHENHENIVARTFGAIRSLLLLGVLCLDTTSCVCCLELTQHDELNVEQHPSEITQL